MGKGYLIDSNVVIGYLDNKLPALGMSFMHPIIDAGPRISVITKIKVLRFNGSEETQQTLENFVKECIIFNLNNDVVEKTIEICKKQKIKLPDAIIAAAALVNGLILITRNIIDFSKTAGLDIINPFDA